MFLLLKNFDATNSLIILDEKSHSNVVRSLKNLLNVKITNLSNLALYDLVKHKKIIFTETTIKELEKKYI